MRLVSGQLLLAPTDLSTFISCRHLTGLISPWAVKRISEFDGDISKFTVVKLYPSTGIRLLVNAQRGEHREPVGF